MSRWIPILISVWLTIACTPLSTMAEDQEISAADANVKSPLPSLFLYFTYSGDFDRTSREANGFGKVQWYMADSSLAMVYIGEFRQGRMHGLGRADCREGRFVIEGKWEHNEPVGGDITLDVSFADSPRFGSLEPDSATTEEIEPPDRLDDFDGMTLPELKSIPEPYYSRFARDHKLSGIVRVSALVGEEGRVKRTKLVSADHVCFAFPTLEAAHAAKFKPARKDGKPMAVWVLIPVRFSAY